ncbi:unnamed protein product [Arabis nemorensis]|uniref:Uncharacterized protein n=1 Tax=Arabis nemorensis TaxID=586526 RepID=A0A565BF03_9BRAS|nr:unnamed protein product [Arabis nemorensis]
MDSDEFVGIFSFTVRRSVQPPTKSSADLQHVNGGCHNLSSPPEPNPLDPPDSPSLTVFVFAHYPRLLPHLPPAITKKVHSLRSHKHTLKKTGLGSVTTIFLAVKVLRDDTFSSLPDSFTKLAQFSWYTCLFLAILGY